MYCSGAVRDYRFAYDLAAPTLPQLIAVMQRRCTGGGDVGSGGEDSADQRQQQQQQQLGGRELLAGGEAAAGRSAAQQQRRRSTQPLLPAACAMALLPRGGRMHAGEGPGQGCGGTCSRCGLLAWLRA